MKYLLLCAAILVGCDSIDPRAETFQVRYEVTGTAESVSLTISNASDNTEQFSDVPLPWTLEFSADEGQFLYVSAQNMGDTGEVTARIYQNYRVVESATSEGAFVIATASRRAQ